MKESRREGIASHPAPESCAASRKAVREALTGAHAGGTSSCEISGSGVPTSSTETEGHTVGSVNGIFERAPRSQRTQQRPSQFRERGGARKVGCPGSVSGRLSLGGSRVL